MAKQRINMNVTQTALCTVMAAILLSGCASSGGVALKKTVAEQSGRVQPGVSKLIAKAEDDVAKQPQDATVRIALANAYLQAGRFESAVTTFEDAQYLGATGDRTALTFALSQIATGNYAYAVALLDENKDQISASDYGLALALAGEAGRGVDVLANALRDGENTVKVRQNLAYAYALDGRWADARVMAAQDVPADQLDERITQWAFQGKPEDYRLRVAGMLGAPVTVDSGQPAHLALARGDMPTLAVAPIASPASSAPRGELPPIESGESFWLAEMPQPEGQPFARPAAIAAKTQSDVATGQFDAAFVAAPAQNSLVLKSAAQSAQTRVASAQPAQRQSRPVTRSRNLVPTLQAKAVSGLASGSHLVQLGSFSSKQNADKAWSHYVARNPELKSFDKKVSEAVVNGKKYWRVSAGGLEKQSAEQVCSTVKRRGEGCFAWGPSNPLPGALNK